MPVDQRVLLDADGRPLRVGQLAMVLDFTVYASGDMAGWNGAMASEIGNIHPIEAIEPYGRWTVARLPNMRYVWHGFWLRGQQNGLKHLVERYQKEVGHANG